MVSLGEAQAVVAAAHPDFVPTAVLAENGVLRVTDFEQSFTVDPATGALLGEVAPLPTWLGGTENLHECFLSCDNRPGYIEWLAAEVPGSGWLGYEGAPITVGALILGVFGLILLFLAVSGLWLWWPRPSRFKASLSVRHRGSGAHRAGPPVGGRGGRRGAGRAVAAGRDLAHRWLSRSW